MTVEKKENHKALIVQVTETLPIKDADKVGDLAVYVQPDSVVPTTEPFRFIWESGSIYEYGLYHKFLEKDSK
jgi:hypothetical protein